MDKTVKFELVIDSSGAIRGVKTADDALKKFDDTLDDVQKSTGGLSDRLKSSGAVGVAVGNMIAGIAQNAMSAFIQGAKDSIRVGMDFQNALAELSAITGKFLGLTEAEHFLNGGYLRE